MSSVQLGKIPAAAARSASSPSTLLGSSDPGFAFRDAAARGDGIEMLSIYIKSSVFNPMVINISNSEPKWGEHPAIHSKGAKTGRNALHQAALNGRNSTCEQLLNHFGFNPLVTDKAGDTPAMCAKRYNHHELASKLEFFEKFYSSDTPQGEMCIDIYRTAKIESPEEKSYFQAASSNSRAS